VCIYAFLADGGNCIRLNTSSVSTQGCFTWPAPNKSSSSQVGNSTRRFI